MRDPRVASNHLLRDAYLYIRQSTPRQVSENGESTRRQYVLRERALSLGWPAERIHIIDQDLGMSGAHRAGRDGFKELVAAVGLRKVGIVLGLEVSRLARNSVDWQQLLQLCAYTDTLILDEEGIYDPSAFNDRLLLGLKGTMSEAELHLLRSRLRGGILNKARRGELALRLPVGLVHLPDGRCAREPDAGIQASIMAVFEAFAATGTIAGTLRQLLASGIRFAQSIWGGDKAGTFIWCDYNRTRVRNILTNPAYAGAFVYGRRTSDPQRQASGRRTPTMVRRPMEQWQCIIHDAYPAYISWGQFVANQERLCENAQRYNDKTGAGRGAPREGAALLQGLLTCGRCGYRMTVAYRPRSRYTCAAMTRRFAEARCQRSADRHRCRPRNDPRSDADGHRNDVGDPSELDRRIESEQHHQLRITRARYECDAARRRFMLVIQLTGWSRQASRPNGRIYRRWLPLRMSSAVSALRRKINSPQTRAAASRRCVVTCHGSGPIRP
jgi:DNA invertase Pin-like site-specific DNA recombinase